MPSYFKRTSLHEAVIDRDLDRIQVAIDAGVDANGADSQGWTPLHFAAQNADLAAARLLLANGANVDAKDTNGNTPLSRAVFCYSGDGDVVSVLREAGADPLTKNANGISPAALARKISNYDISKYFVDVPELNKEE